jgi:hypothetical protein
MCGTCTTNEQSTMTWTFAIDPGVVVYPTRLWEASTSLARDPRPIWCSRHFKKSTYDLKTDAKLDKCQTESPHSPHT